jgi:putative tryptophan/tyrosine transport system substrate-binding protein
MKLGLILVLAILSVPLPADAQQPARLHRIGVLSHDSFPPTLLESFRGGLRELGYVEGKTIALETQHADGKIERLAALADDLVRLKVDVIFAVHTPAALAAKKATTAIPIVVTRVADPVKTGLVSNISRPGGNITGLSFIPELLSGKRLELLKEALPGVRRIAALWTADNPGATVVAMAMEPASAQLGLQLLKVPVRSHSEFGAAVEAAKRDGASALIVTDDAFVTRHRVELLKLAARHSLPVFSLFEPVAEAGGLMAYGPSTPDMYRRAAYYVDRILKGEKPGDLPIEQPTRFHLVVNLKTAKALGLEIPASLQLRADRLID